MARLAELVRNGGRRTSDEARLMRLLAVLVEDYDRRHALPPGESTPDERLKYLLERSGRTPTDLLGVFGRRSHVNEALNGKRPISAAGQARKLAALLIGFECSLEIPGSTQRSTVGSPFPPQSPREPERPLDRRFRSQAIRSC